jgi:UrcA family protein
MKLFSSLIALAAPVALAYSACPAAARTGIVITGAQPELTRSQQVVFGDIDLTTAEGERLLTHRVAVAVRDICSDRAEHPLALLPCKRSAWGSARPQMAAAIERAADNPQMAQSGSITVAW